MLCLRLPLVAQNTLLRSRGSVEVDWDLPLLDSDLENDFVPVDDEALPGNDEGPTGSPNPTATTTTMVARSATAPPKAALVVVVDVVVTSQAVAAVLSHASVSNLLDLCRSVSKIVKNPPGAASGAGGQDDGS